MIQLLPTPLPTIPEEKDPLSALTAHRLLPMIRDRFLIEEKRLSLCHRIIKVVRGYKGERRTITPFIDGGRVMRISKETNDIIVEQLRDGAYKVMVTFDRILGEGSYKLVKAGRSIVIKSDKKMRSYPIAITKSVNYDEEDTKKIINGFDLERCFYSHHPDHLPRVFFSTRKRFIFTEQERYFGTLDKITLNLTPSLKIGFFVPILRTLNRLHSSGIIHNDIKESNIFYRKMGKVFFTRLGDFDLAVDIKKKWNKKTQQIAEYQYWDDLRKSGYPLPTTDIFGWVICMAATILGDPFKTHYWKNSSTKELLRKSHIILIQSLAEHKEPEEKLVVIKVQQLLVKILKCNDKFFTFANKIYDDNFGKKGFNYFAFHEILLKNYPLFYPSTDTLIKEIEPLSKNLENCQQI